MRRFGLLLFLCAFPGCDASDVVAVRVRLNDDFSGTLTVSALRLPEQAGPAEGAATGIQWKDRVTVAASGGAFQSLSAVKIDEVSFSAGRTEAGMRFVRVTLPRGADKRWTQTLTVVHPDERKRAAETFDPSGRMKRIGALIKFEIELPKPPVGHGFTPSLPGLEEKVEKRLLTLVVPVDQARAKGDDIEWHVTWQE